MKELLILGGGTGGSMMANRLARSLNAKSWRITVVDRDDIHIYQPGLLFLPFGDSQEGDILRPRKRLLESSVRMQYGEIDRIDAEARQVYLQDGTVLPYDLLIIATGATLHPEWTEGLSGPGWQSSAFDFYSLEGSKNLAGALARFEGGRLIVNLIDNPIKCPVAPLEFAFLADHYLRKRGIRERTELVYVTSLEGAFTKPRASALLGQLLQKKDIHVVADFALASVDGERQSLKAWDGRVENYDLLVTVPLHGGSAAIQRSGLGNDAGFFPTDKHTLQSKAHPEIFALGDATDLPASKAGAVAHFQSEVLIDNIHNYLNGQPLKPDFDGHANCFIETGYGKALLIDFNYTTEPLPGRFPLPGAGPFTLLEESHVNHWGKLGFRWVYWNMLVRGEALPLDHRMITAGKWA